MTARAAFVVVSALLCVVCRQPWAVAQAGEPQSKPGGAVGPIVGVGRSDPLTPAQAEQNRKDQIQALLKEFAGEDENLRDFAAAQIAAMGAPALLMAREAALAKDLTPATRQRFELLIAVMSADATARPALEKFLKEKSIAGGQLEPIVDNSLHEAFPGCSFYVLRFRQFPVAHETPTGMKPSNVFAAKPDGSVEHLTDAQAAKVFFQKTLAPVKSAAAAKRAARAWMRISQEWRQDGFYQFAIPADGIVVEGGDGKTLRVTAKALVKGGGNAGNITAMLSFDPDGKLVTVTDAGRVREGIRPICQATKLLDPDPIVRGMARQSILVMGLRAQDYLAEQRAKASPQLQAQIDLVWRRIVAEGR